MPGVITIAVGMMALALASAVPAAAQTVVKCTSAAGKVSYQTGKCPVESTTVALDDQALKANVSPGPDSRFGIGCGVARSMQAQAERQSTMTTSGSAMRSADRTREQMAQYQKQWNCYR
ncbi:hypothetical protein BH10PSE17_BH10PSE17_00430 [soil metagenome]